MRAGLGLILFALYSMLSKGQRIEGGNLLDEKCKGRKKGRKNEGRKE